MVHPLLSNVSEQRYFKVADGTILKNLSDLGAALLHMDDSIFRHHVTTERNDFFNWVRDVHKDQRLALELMHAKTRQDAAISVNRRVQELLQPTPIPLPSTNPRPIVRGEVKEIKQLFSPKVAPSIIPVSKPVPASPIPAKEPLKSPVKNITRPAPLTNQPVSVIKQKEVRKSVSRSPSTIVSVSRNVTPVRSIHSKGEPEIPSATSRFSLFSGPMARHQLIVTFVAILFLVFFLGTSSQVISLTGAATSAISPEEIQFVGIWGAIAVIVLVVVALKVIRERHHKA